MDDGDTRIRIQLQPRELGRIEIRLEVSESGKVTALISAERSDTLDLLMRDSRGLEKALQNAGLDVDANSLAFDLDDGEDEADDAVDEATATPDDDVIETEIVLPAATILSGPGAGRIDISV